MVGRRSSRGYDPSEDRNRDYRSYSRFSGESSRYSSRNRAASSHGRSSRNSDDFDSFDESDSYNDYDSDDSSRSRSSRRSSRSSSSDSFGGLMRPAHSESDRKGGRKHTRSGMTARKAIINGRTRPSTRPPYHDTFYEDLLTDGIFDGSYDDYEEEELLMYADFEMDEDAAYYANDFDDDDDDYEDEDDYDYEEETPQKNSASSYSRDRYGSRARKTDRHSDAYGASDDYDDDDYDDDYEDDELEGSHARHFSSVYSADRYRRPKSKSHFGTNRKAILVVVLVAAVVLVGSSVFAFANTISNNLQRGINDDLRNVLVETDMANEPFYMLLLGTDGSADRDNSGEFGDMYRSDSIMLVRIDPVEKKVALVSISRDILVDLGEYGEQKLNAAYGLGGPALTVEAVSKLTGVDISHYAQVDFDGFSDLVDALGGVTVNVPVEIDDAEAGGKVLAGEQVLNGHQALILCRSRNTYTDVSAQPDAMRAANQRLVMSAIANKLLDADIGTIAGSVKELSNFVSTDLSLTDIIGLAQAMEGLDSASDIYTAMAPTKSQYIKDVSVDYIDQEAWNKMMQRIQQGLPPTEDAEVDEITGTITAYVGTDVNLNAAPKHASIVVKNGTAREGLASQTRNVLLSYGYNDVVIGDINTDYHYPRTLVVYDKESAEYGAQQIAEMIGQGKVLYNDGQYLMPDTDFMIIIGEDWT